MLNARKKKIIFSVFVSTIVLIIVTSCVIQFLVNSQSFKIKISSLIQEKTGIQTEPSMISFTLFPNPGITVKNLNYNFDKIKLFEIKELNCDVKFDSLLHGEFSLGRLHIQDPTIDFSVLKFIPDQTSKLHQLETIKTALKKIFDLLPENQKKIEVRIDDTASSFYKSMAGSIVFEKDTHQVLFDISAEHPEFDYENFTGTSLTAHFNIKSLRADKISINGKINSDFDIIGQVSSQDLLIEPTGGKPQFTASRIDIPYHFSESLIQIDINPFQIHSQAGIVSIHFSSDFSKNDIYIKFTGNHIDIGQAREMCLSVFKNNDFVEHLFDILRSGISSEISVSFRANNLSSLFNAEHLELAGTIENGCVKIPGTDLIANDIQGKARIKNGIFDIETDRSLLETSRIKKGQLKIDLLGHKHIPFDSTFQIDADLSMIPKTISSLLPDTLLAKELMKVHNINGRANIRLYLSIPTESDRLITRFESENFSISGNYERVPGQISLERVNFKFDKGLASLSQVKGTANGATIQNLDALLNFNQDPQIEIKSGSGEINLGSLLPFLSSFKKIEDLLSPLKRGNGKIDISSVQMSGPILSPEKWIYDIHGKADHISLSTKQNQKQIENFSGQYQISNRGFSLKNIFATLEELSWLEPVFEKTIFESLQYPLSIENTNLQSTQMKSSGSVDVNFPGGQKISISFEGADFKSLNMNKINLIDPGFSNATLLLSNNEKKKAYSFSGILNTDSLNRIFLSHSPLWSQIYSFTAGEPLLFHTDNDSIINILTKKLNVSSFFSSEKSFISNHQFFLNNSFKLKIENLIFHQWVLQELNSEISLKNQNIDIRLNNAVFCNLETKGDISLKKDHLYANIPFRSNNKDTIQAFMSCIFNKSDLIDGRYSLNGHLFVDAEKKDILKAINGLFLFKSEEGRVYKFTLLSRILSILNVSNLLKGTIPDITQNGFAFKLISIEAEIKGSVIHIKNAIVDGNDMTIIFNGSIDPLNDSIDLTCLVAPFKTADLIIEKIPILNTLMNRNLISVPVKASGKIFDPVVVPLHPSAVGEGLINMMTNILKTPIKILDKITTDEKAPSPAQ